MIGEFIKSSCVSFCDNIEEIELLGAPVAGSNLFNLGRHKVGAQHYRNLRISAFTDWSRAVV
jgi:hypothetical protein